METPQEYILAGEGEATENWSKFSNMEWGKKEAIANANQLGTTWTIYKLVPVFEARVEVTRKVITKDIA